MLMKISNTFPYNALIMCLCHEISVKQPHYDAVARDTNNHDEKKQNFGFSPLTNEINLLHLKIQSADVTPCSHMFSFIHPTSCISIKLLVLPSALKRLQEPFKPGSQPTLTICAPHFEQRLKKPRVSRRFALCASSSQHIKGLDEEVQAQSGYYSEDSSIKSSS